MVNLLSLGRTTSQYEYGRSWTSRYANQSISQILHSFYPQLFLEEERERELEQIYEDGVADTFNVSDRGANHAGDEGVQDQVEVAGVSKQTTETLMAGERIMEALDLADNELAAFHEYEEAMSRLSADDAMRLQPPPRNPVLAAYDLEPEAYVLQVVEKVQGPALQDALLVLPFGKVVSLMLYLNIWAQRVSILFAHKGLRLTVLIRSGT
jgi:U3 small nucleolar RNA-associated protein 12